MNSICLYLFISFHSITISIITGKSYKYPYLISNRHRYAKIPQLVLGVDGKIGHLVQKHAVLQQNIVKEFVE